jgi:plasmid stabilization system protein ParE
MLENADRPTSSFQWTDRHRAAITTASAQYYADLTGRITEALRRARAFLRAVQDAVRTAVDRIDLEQLRRDYPLDTIVYANNSRHPADAWAGASITWQAVTTANTAACRTALDDLDISYVEVRDGADCGWTSHDDPDRANRTLRTVQDALAHASAHPHCQREFLPRLDLVGRSEIRTGAPL